ncbi:purine-nucleoside phosphorylase [candidate division KSB1 bacterium]|nr:purine-nucleoside phosphorylase [candidate division KSB1 bacterium]
MDSPWINITEASCFIQKKYAPPDVRTAIILGSGLGALADELQSPRIVETAFIPHWPTSTVSGHKGRLIFGELDGTPLLVVQGRVHYYEGYQMDRVVFPVRVLAQLGIRNLIVTNAAGALNPEFSPGDLMIIEDHINLMGTNPLIGPNEDNRGPRFPDMSEPYNRAFIQTMEKAALELDIPIQKGVLAVTHGPTYETAAEVKMLRTLGGDAVCMSTVPEVIAAVHLGLRNLGISCITNMATGLSDSKLSHSEVELTAGIARDKFIRLIRKIIPTLDII